MTRLEWDGSGSRHYEAGVDRGVLYPAIGPGVPWNGLISVKELENDTSSESIVYVDGQRYITKLGIGSFAAMIGALTTPPEFDQYDGYDDRGFSNQIRKTFGFAYRSFLGDDVHGESRGYLLNLVYNALATPALRSNISLADVPDPNAFVWGISTTPVAIPNARITAHFVIDSTSTDPDIIQALEAKMYGTELTEPTMPTALDVIELFDSYATFIVIDNGDGSATIIGDDDAVELIFSDTAQLTSPGVVQKSSDTYRVSSY